MYLAKVYVTYKQSILNPEAEAIKDAVVRMGYDDVKDLTLGKYFEVKIDGTNVEHEIDEICDKLLANVNMESYRYEIEELEAAK
ncbi:phosphoribosylformylglycinamidine synthase subunit PurS [Lentilactobacillus sp. Marseille-Q4993]|uniref:phosphoribosylformylglycinamidine synthase subunit PurS n=1 Tax=Lentilactobacillus sp. Marseille-Q4993 TaxID=3039492 RepID=UPI0024BC6314|nr:phosphoribosylformylglycinamidine synthase subunit PurS [Lentilactobacillus sp. Marseille-Q4993]